MKTRGIVVGENGYLIFPDKQIVPPAFWSRLKHEAAKAGALDELTAEYREARDRVHAEREKGWTSTADEFDAEARFYRRWVERLHGAQDVWPWTRGWSEPLVDAYPLAAAAREAA
jgi:hypothetical protein